MSSDRTSRDVRLDFVRGVALLVIATNHLPNNPLSELTPRNWGPSDMAEVFVFLSGYVLGLRTRQHPDGISRRFDFWYWRRAMQLYAAYVVTGTLVVWLIRRFQIGAFAGQVSATLLVENPPRLLSDVARWRGEVGHLTILPLYVVLLLATPLVLGRVRFRPLSLGLASFSVYLLSQLSPNVLVPQPGQTTLYYNPWAWQLLYFGGMSLALGRAARPRTAGRAQNDESPNGRRELAVALLVLGGCLMIRGAMGDVPPWLTRKPSLGPLRVVHFTALAVIGHALLPREFNTWQRRLSAPFRLCGRQSLMTYCSGAVLVVLVTAWLTPCRHRRLVSGTLLENLAVWGGCMVAAWLWERIKQIWSEREFGRFRRRGSPQA